MLGPILRGEKITLEPLRIEDIHKWREWLADLKVTRYLLMRFVPSLKDEEGWYDRVADSNADVMWGIFADGLPIGSTGIHGIDWINRHASTGTMIGEKSAWGKGYASEVVTLRTDYAFQELGLERLETESCAKNVPMHRALKKSGYREIGRRRRHVFKGGVWHDVLLFELLRDEWLTRQS